MFRVLFAETAVFADLEAIGIVLLVLHGIVITLLAIAACEGNSHAHSYSPPTGLCKNQNFV
jgi:hypothetical protein